MYCHLIGTIANCSELEKRFDSLGENVYNINGEIVGFEENIYAVLHSYLLIEAFLRGSAECLSAL